MIESLKIKSLSAKMGQGLGQFWNIELFQIDGSSFSIGKVVTGICLLVLSYILSKRAAHSIEKRVFSKLNLAPNLKMNLQRLFFYFFLSISFLFTLHLLRVPITIFAVLGGVLAIGLGFGSQNVVNNFISGLILMIEQPVRVGDTVEVDNVRGVIEIIGIRSTHVRTAENREVVIPNSYFLEKVVVNSTLTTDVVRGRVQVGVEYGASPEKVRQVLLEIVAQHPSILPEPRPMVLLADFGDSALVFQILYWYNMQGIKPKDEIESDIRFQICAEFQRLNINIPFPQREVRVISERSLSH